MTDTPKNPWDDKVAEAFEDPEVAAKVSAFLGESVQPYVTKIEQEARPSRDATRLWEALESAPVDTSIQIVKEMFGDDLGDQFAALLQGGEPSQVEVPTPEAEETEDDKRVAFDDLPPEVQNAVAAQQQEEQRKAYYSEIDRVKDANADKLPTVGEGDEAEVQLDVDLFHPFVVAAGGDFDAAMEGYLGWQDKAKESFGINVPETAAVEEAQEPPPVIDSSTRESGTKPPTEEKYETLDDAIDSFFEDQKNPPPTVGTA